MLIRSRSTPLTLLLIGVLFLAACQKDEVAEPEPEIVPPVVVVDYSNYEHLVLGNPSNATTSTGVPENYLMRKDQFALAYNSSRGTASWVSWHLSTSWTGNVPRCDCFTPDAALPTSFFWAQTTQYTNSGFDRGHMTPSADRNATYTANAATFLMTNILPQAPLLNQGPWAVLEDYARSRLNAGNEVYIISGGYGSGGTGSLGGITYTLAGGQITVPARFWKVLVIIPEGDNDLGRVSASTRVIAVDMPNTQGVNTLPWGSYRTSVDAIEASTGLDLLSLVPVEVQTVLESAVDNGPTQ